MHANRSNGEFQAAGVRAYSGPQVDRLEGIGTRNSCRVAIQHHSRSCPRFLSIYCLHLHSRPATGARHAPILLLTIREANIHSGSLGGHPCIVFTAFLGFRANLASTCRNSPLVHFAPRGPWRGGRLHLSTQPTRETPRTMQSGMRFGKT
jgi:hypothetical protein